MASQVTNSESPEFKTLIRLTNDLIQVLKCSVKSLGDVLLGKGIIPHTLYESIRENTSSTSATRDLVSFITTQVKQKPSLYHTFQEILKTEGRWTEPLREKMASYHQSELVKFQQNQKVIEDGELLPSSDSRSGIDFEKLSLKTKFPHLDVSSLNEHEKKDLERKLTADIRSMIFRFSNFSVVIRESLESRIPLDKIKYTILSLDGFVEDIGAKVLDPKDEEKIENADSLAKIFLSLRHYISFFNFRIVEHLVHQYGTTEDKAQLVEYCKELNAFCQRNVYEVPCTAYSNPRPEAKTFILKCTQHTLTLCDVQVLKDRVCELFHLNDYSLQLFSIEEGCVELCFLISAAIAERIFPVSPSQHSALSEIGVRIVSENHQKIKEGMLNKERIPLHKESVTQSAKGKESVSWTDYTTTGNRDALYVMSDPKKLDKNLDIVPRRPRELVAMEPETCSMALGMGEEYQHLGQNSISNAAFHCQQNIEIVKEVFGEKETCQTVTKRIRTLIQETSKEGVILSYTGPGKKGTGDWCFRDGFITFREIMDLYTQHFRGRVLTIISDCSYSGSWVREAMAFMDEQGVGPCGHMAKEKGIFIKVFASCQPEEIPVEMVFSTIYGLNNARNWKIDLYTDEIHAYQHPSGLDFTEVRCNNTICQPCTMAPGSTWERWGLAKRLRRVRGVVYNDQHVWHFILLADDIETIAKLEERAKMKSFDVADHGQILRSGWGQEPPSVVTEWIHDNYCMNYNYQYII